MDILYSYAPEKNALYFYKYNGMKWDPPGTLNKSQSKQTRIKHNEDSKDIKKIK